TRSKRDWSSDVCSSDLRRGAGAGMGRRGRGVRGGAERGGGADPRPRGGGRRRGLGRRARLSARSGGSAPGGGGAGPRRPGDLAPSRSPRGGHGLTSPAAVG